MHVFEFEVKGKIEQYRAIDETIRTAQFVYNKCLRYWMDNRGVGRYDLNKHCRVLAQELTFAKKLNSQARQSSAERAWSAIARFFDNCKKGKPDKKGHPKFKKNARSVEYKTTGWKLHDPKHVSFTDGNNIGKLKLVGTWDLAFYPVESVKRVRLVRRADGYYCQFCIDVGVKVESEPTGKAIGLDLGSKYFLASSDGGTVESPSFYRKGEKALNLANRRKSKKYNKGVKPQSRNYHRVRNRYSRKHLRVSRQREEFVKRVALRLIQSNDLVAHEDLNVKGMVRNRHLSESIGDAGWHEFRRWLEYFGRKYGKVTVAVPPPNTSQDCFNCGEKVQKSLSTRTHVCPHCGYAEDRDVNAAKNILQLGLRTVGHTGTSTLGKTEVGAELDASGSVTVSR